MLCKYLSCGGMNADQLIEMLFRGAELEGDTEALRHLASVRPEVVQANDAHLQQI